jgi:lactoylglutathione lyase
MYQKDFTAISTASPEMLWLRYADVTLWKTWDKDIERVTLEGPFVKGACGTMSLNGKLPLDFVLTEVTPNVSFSDEAKAGPMTVRFTHLLERLTGGTKVTHRVCIEGPAAEQLGANLQVQSAVDAFARLGTEQTPMTLGGVILYTPDVTAKVAFYEKAFGLEVSSRAPEDVYVQMKGAVPLAFTSESFVQTMLPVVPRSARLADAPAAVELMLIVDDVPSAFTRAVKAGATALVAPVTKRWGQVVAYVRDLDGVLIELCTPWA